MIKQGWVTIHRRILDWEWYNDHEVFRLFMFMLLSANHADGKYKGVLVPRGSLITERIALSEKTGLSQQQIRTAINKLKSTGEITSKNTNKYSIISITNWDEYQTINQQNNQPSTSHQPAINQPSTTNNNKNNKNNETSKAKDIGNKKPLPARAKFKPPTIDEIKAHSKEKALPDESDNFWNFYESNGWKVGKNKMSSWKSAFSGWCSRKDQFTKKVGNGEYIINQDVWNSLDF